MAKIGFVSLGCAKNLVDSEVMLGLLARNGHQIAPQEEAEIIVVNTCGFIESAKQESIDTILEMARHKASGPCRKLIVAGCLVERYRKEIQDEIPEVDSVMGTNEIPGIVALCDEGSDLQEPPRFDRRESYLYSDTDPRILTTPAYSAYIKIAEGCDHPCTFCVIPQMRGRFRSRPLESVLAEAARLAAQGVRELNLVAQDSTQYGWDLGNRRGLAQLIPRLAVIEGIEWVRLLYAYPNTLYDALLEAIAETPQACKYLDMPLQHASRSVLRRMKRGGSASALLKLLLRIRQTIPGVAIRTTLMVGFPGETEKEFEELMDFVREAQFDRLGVFTYSDEDAAASHALGGKIAEDVKKARRDRLMQLQSKLARKKNRELLGKTLPVLVEGVSRETEWLWTGRLSTQAPEVDGVVYLNDGIHEGIRPGDIMSVRISQVHEYDLVGAVV